MLKYRIRLAELNDLGRCTEIDASYITTHVWQLQESFDEPIELTEEEGMGRVRPKIAGKMGIIAPPSFRVSLTPSRLPHPLAVTPPLNDQQLLAEWKKTDHLLVAEAIEKEKPAGDPLLEAESQASQALPLLQSPSANPDILGYVGLTVDGPRHVAWITTGAVQLDARRKGVGTALLNEARAWGDRYRLRSLLVELQTKNFPAISFFQKNGFFFCGYNNAYYPTREIALFFGKRLEKFN